MTFELTDGDGNTVKQIYSCTECTYVSTKRHFRTTDDGVECILCSSPAEKSSSIQTNTGMSSFEYRRMLGWLQENRAGIGPSTIESIEEEFPDGDDFLDAAEDAYRNMNLDALTEVDGIGEGYARGKIALGIAEYRGWEDGDAEPVETESFTFRKA